MPSTRSPLVPTLGRAALGTWRRTSRTARVGLGALASGLLLGATLTLLWVQEPDVLQLTAAPRAAAGSTHLALDGEAVLLKAVLTPRPGHALTYEWSFGDDSDPVRGSVLDPFSVSAVHTYPPSEPGTHYLASLRVTDEATGESVTSEYPIRFVEPTQENKRSIVLDDALWSLHASMLRGNDYVHGPIGHWDTHEYPVASTAMAVLSFEVNGFDARDERKGNPYEATVERGLTYLLSALQTVELTPQPAGDPDSNGNGLGISVRGAERPLYEAPLVAMALIAGQDPDRRARTGADGVVGRRYEDIVVDILDYLAFAQVDREGAHRGGWRYRANARDADMSVTQWPVLAFLSARTVWGLDAPAWVKQELGDHFLKHVQAADGGFDYQPGRGRATVGLTGAGLIGLAFADVAPDDERVVRATQFIETHWSESNVGDFYNMYAVMKGALLTRRPIRSFGEHDWLAEYVAHLHASQQDLGHWTRGGRWAAGTRRTAWPALILSKDVFATSRPAQIAWGWVVTLSLLLLGLGLLLVRRARRVSADRAEVA